MNIISNNRIPSKRKKKIIILILILLIGAFFFPKLSGWSNFMVKEGKNCSCLGLERTVIYMGGK